MSMAVAEIELRPLQSAHAEAMLRWMLDPEIADNVGLRSTPTLERTQAWIARTDVDAQAIYFAGRHVGNVVLDQFDDYLQTARLSVYLGEPSARGRGVAREALRMALAHGFGGRQLYRIWLTVHARNARALALYNGLGFRQEGVLRGDVLLRGDRVDAVLLSMLRSEFENLAK